MGTKMAKANFCQFCQILRKKENLLYEDDKFFAFHDICKATAQEHILVCTNQHLNSCMDIRDEETLHQMEKITRLILAKMRPGAQYRVGFHLPGSTSVDHVHMHGFVLPIESFWQNQVRYGWMLKSVQHVLGLKRPKL